MSHREPTPELIHDIADLLERERVAVFVVAYNSEAEIEVVLRRIPGWIAKRLTEIYVIDDHSQDATAQVVRDLQWSPDFAPLRVFRTPINQGYGGNQKLGYTYAIAKKYDIVVLLHGDGQYAPEALPFILEPYLSGADAVFGSRLLNRWNALRGGMPLYKWIGNQVLTFAQNRILRMRMSEMHSGYRSYRMSALKELPFQCNSNGFDFDADIIIQFNAARKKIVEVPIPTYYGTEICRVNGMQYALRCILAALRFRLMQFELFYDPKFDIRNPSRKKYVQKSSRHSVHHYVRNLPLATQARVIDIGGGDGSSVGTHLTDRAANVTCLDQDQTQFAPNVVGFNVDLDRSWTPQIPAGTPPFNVALALDILEHLKCPEEGVREIFNQLESKGILIASTGNIAFFPLRIMLALGQFNYGRRGILDLTHKRLFTISSFRRLLENGGFQVVRVSGFGFPIQDLTQTENSLLLGLESFLAFLARAWPSLFAYQILVEAIRPHSHESLLSLTFGDHLNLSQTTAGDD